MMVLSLSISFSVCVTLRHGNSRQLQLGVSALGPLLVFPLNSDSLTLRHRDSPTVSRSVPC